MFIVVVVLVDLLLALRGVLGLGEVQVVVVRLALVLVHGGAVLVQQIFAPLLVVYLLQLSLLWAHGGAHPVHHLEGHHQTGGHGQSLGCVDPRVWVELSLEARLESISLFAISFS